MGRLIDADNLLSGIYTDNPDDIMHYIATCDAVDAVQVVRCRYCKYCNGPFCRHPDTNGCRIRADGYCDKGILDD